MPARNGLPRGPQNNRCDRDGAGRPTASRHLVVMTVTALRARRTTLCFQLPEPVRPGRVVQTARTEAAQPASSCNGSIAVVTGRRKAIRWSGLSMANHIPEAVLCTSAFAQNRIRRDCAFQEGNKRAAHLHGRYGGSSSMDDPGSHGMLEWSGPNRRTRLSPVTGCSETPRGCFRVRAINWNSYPDKPTTGPAATPRRPGLKQELRSSSRVISYRLYYSQTLGPHMPATARQNWRRPQAPSQHHLRSTE